MADSKIRKVMQLDGELFVEGDNGLWYELREAVSGGRFVDELRHPRVVMLVPESPARPSDDQLIGGAAATSRLYIDAVVEAMEKAVISAVQSSGAAIRREMQVELSGDEPFKALIAAADQIRSDRKGVEQT
jgi:hypothetical protein